MRAALIPHEVQRSAVVSTAAEGELLRACALRDAGHAVTVLLPAGNLAASAAREAWWRAQGFACELVAAQALAEGQDRFPREIWLWTARALAGALERFDLVWFFAAEWAMPGLRERRFRERTLPVFVLEAAPGPEPIPQDLGEINRAFARRYALERFDVVGSAELTAEGCLQRAETLWLERSGAEVAPMRAAATSPAVTVCVPYFEAPEFLPETLASLDAQTTSNFTVIVVDDGSHTELARTVFAACERQYAERGWRFLRQSNAGSGAARNRAAEAAETEFLLFLDADDIAMPTMVERFLRGALLTGDDCLVAPNYGFRDDPDGPYTVLYDPPGNSLIASMGDDMHGGACLFVRRDAFARLGGFTTLRGVGFEDYELHVRANLMGLRWDVLPERIYAYRLPRAGGVSQSTAAYANLARVLRWYAERLRPIHLERLPLAFAALYWRNEGMQREMSWMRRPAATGAARRGASRQRLLLLTCNFPFGLNSGWHNRVQRMIAYFGQRYELTLMTTMPREQFAPLRKEALQHVKMVLGVEGCAQTAAAAGLPFRVREQYSETMQAALRALPGGQYDAAVLDQIFMAECRNDLKTPLVLTEHNIESRLLRQAAESHWRDQPDAAVPLHYRNALAEAQLLERYEDRVWAEFTLRAVVSEVDRAEVDRRCADGLTVVAANGADPASFQSGVRFAAKTVLFAGHLAYLPNVDGVVFLLGEIWPLVRARLPEARLILAGRDPSALVKEAVAAAGGERAGIELCASPASMDAVAERASVSVAPLRLGSGTRCKILDSMAWGLPVVSTTLGAEGIAAGDGEHLLVRDDPQAFAEAMVRLLSDEPLWAKLRHNGHALIAERYSWESVFAPMDEALQRLIG